MIKLFESYILSESLSDGNFYDLFGKTVYVYDTEYSGGEYIIFYENEDGSKHQYRDTLREIQQDFVRTDKSFVLKPTKISIQGSVPKLKPKVKSKPKVKRPEYFNIVFYMGNKKLETIQANVHKTKAYPLKGYFQKLDKYRRGTVKVEPIVSKKRFESINNEEYYTLEYLTDNLTTVNMDKIIDATKECQYGWVIEEQKAGSTQRAGEDLSNKYDLNGVVGEWVYPFNSAYNSNESLCFGLKELLREDNRYSVEIDKLYEEYLKLNPTIKDIPIKDSFDKYEVMLGMTSGYNFDDIYDWIVIGSAPSRDDNYRSLKNELQTVVGHIGYVPSEKTIRNIINQL